MASKIYTFIDLFAGLGGFRIALESLGAKCVYASELDETVKKVYAKNVKLSIKSIIINSLNSKPLVLKTLPP